MRRIYVIGTCDTKGDELRFACACIARAGAKALLVDVSTGTPDASADVTAETIAAHGIVSIHAASMRPAMRQRTALNLVTLPTPMIAPAMV